MFSCENTREPIFESIYRAREQVMAVLPLDPILSDNCDPKEFTQNFLYEHFQGTSVSCLLGDLDKLMNFALSDKFHPLSGPDIFPGHNSLSYCNHGSSDEKVRDILDYYHNSETTDRERFLRTIYAVMKRKYSELSKSKNLPGLEEGFNAFRKIVSLMNVLKPFPESYHLSLEPYYWQGQCVTPPQVQFPANDSVFNW
jgi:hypothetical protein